MDIDRLYVGNLTDCVVSGRLNSNSSRLGCIRVVGCED